MNFAAPIWLAALLPWAGVTIYLLLGQRSRANVPFLELWRSPIVAPRVQRSMHRAPMWIVLLLAAIAAAIVAASNPQLNTHAAAPNDFDELSRVAVSQSADVGIESLTSRGDQVMVRVLNVSLLTHTDIEIQSDGSSKRYPIDLPPTGESRNYFFDVPADAGHIRAALVAADSRSHGAAVEIERRRDWPRLQSMSPLPAEVKRMLAVYASHRPASDSSARLGILTGDVSRLAGQPGVALADASTAVTVSPSFDGRPATDPPDLAGRPAIGLPEVSAHPVTAAVNWPAALADATLAASPPEGFTAVVSVAGKMAVGVRETPARQVWVGFDSKSFARSPDIVIFWTNLLDWAGQGGEAFQPVPGTTFATRASPATPKPPEPAFDLAPWLACVAAGLSVLALAVAPRRIA